MRWWTFPSKDVLHVLNFGSFCYFLVKWPGTCLGVTNFPKSDIKHHNIHSFIQHCTRFVHVVLYVASPWLCAARAESLIYHIEPSVPYVFSLFLFLLALCCFIFLPVLLWYFNFNLLDRLSATCISKLPVGLRCLSGLLLLCIIWSY